MYTQDQNANGPGLVNASGEELLLMAIFGAPNTKTRIDEELDRRALACVPAKTGVIGHTATHTSDYGFAA